MQWPLSLSDPRSRQRLTSSHPAQAQTLTRVTRTIRVSLHTSSSYMIFLEQFQQQTSKGWYKENLVLLIHFNLTHPENVRADGRRLLSPQNDLFLDPEILLTWRDEGPGPGEWAGHWPYLGRGRSGHRIHQCHLIIKHLGLSHLDKVVLLKRYVPTTSG